MNGIDWRTREGTVQIPSQVTGRESTGADIVDAIMSSDIVIPAVTSSGYRDGVLPDKPGVPHTDQSSLYLT